MLLKTFIVSIPKRPYSRGSRFERPPKVERNVREIVRRRDIVDDGQQYSDDPEIFHHEGDFMSVHDIYDRKVVHNTAREKNIMMKNKYFKEKHYNFLTWAEKKEIRGLHAEDPETWSIERLADSFPASVSTIAKVASAKWCPKYVEHIKRHDAAVKRTWAAFQNNNIGYLDAEFTEHLKKFTHRDITSKIKVLEALEKPDHGMNKGTEFVNIIKSCKKQQQSNDAIVTYTECFDENRS